MPASFHVGMGSCIGSGKFNPHVGGTEVRAKLGIALCMRWALCLPATGLGGGAVDPGPVASPLAKAASPTPTSGPLVLGSALGSTLNSPLGSSSGSALGAAPVEAPPEEAACTGVWPPTSSGWPGDGGGACYSALATAWTQGTGELPALHATAVGDGEQPG